MFSFETLQSPARPRFGRLLIPTLLSASLVACGGNGSQNDPDPQRPAAPQIGDSDFLSAGPGSVGGGGGRGAEDDFNGGGDPTAQPDAPNDGGGDQGPGSDRSVEEGDIFRVYADNLILNLNYYRGVQLIDVSNVDVPRIAGRVGTVGTPVELYTIDSTAIVLLNNYEYYYRGAADWQPERYNGAYLMAIDISDPENPVIVGELPIEGDISTSRLVRGEAGDALYVVSQRYHFDDSVTDGGGNDVVEDAPDVARPGGGGVANNGHQTYVTSFDVSNPAAIAEVEELSLGGYVEDIYASASAMVVARNDWFNDYEQRARLQIIDISNPSGDMVEQGEVEVEGHVADKFKMNIRGNVLSVFAHDWNEGGRRGALNRLTTFDVSDRNNPVQADTVAFGENEDLYATLYVDDAAFAVTYRRVDPFHTFSIEADGTVTERAEFIVSGWNDFFKPVANDSRLLGVGINDEGGDRTVALSLYDITDLENPEPLVDRESVAFEWSHSTANWDDKAFTIVEGAVDVDGETGLVLLPFSGWSDDARGYFSGAQIFTFNSEGITRRGTLDHGSQVQRSFLAEDSIANLSEEELTLFDFSDIDNPELASRLELAPHNASFYALSNGHGVKRIDSNPWGHWGDVGSGGRGSVLRVVPLNAADIDTADAVASVEIPAGASTLQVGNSIVALETEWDPETESTTTTATVYDFSDPANPTQRGSVDTDADLRGMTHYGCYDYCYDDVGGGVAPPSGRGGVAVDEPAPADNATEPEPTEPEMDSDGEFKDVAPGGYHYGGVRGVVVGQSIAFLSPRPMQESLGMWESCYAYGGEEACWYGDDSPPSVGGGGSTGSMGGGGSDTPGTEVPPDAMEEPDFEPGADGEDSGEFKQRRPSPDGEDFEDGKACEWYSGGVHCEQGPDSDRQCWGELARCDESGDCQTIDVDSSDVEWECDTNERFRYWTAYSLVVLDLSDLTDPHFTTPVELEDRHEVTGWFGGDDAVYYSFREASDTQVDGQRYFRYFFREVGLDDPSAPSLGTQVNIPGTLVHKDGARLVTEDYAYTEDGVISSLNVLELDGSRAVLRARRSYDDRVLRKVFFNGDNAYVAHSVNWSWLYRTYGDDGWRRPEANEVRFSILDLTDSDLADRATLNLETWAELQTVEAQKAFFQVPGGVLLVDVEEAGSPALQAFFPARGWPQNVVVEGEQAFVPAGRYGLYSLGIDEVTIADRLGDTN